jgi:hypothetical protein
MSEFKFSASFYCFDSIFWALSKQQQHVLMRCWHRKVSWPSSKLAGNLNSVICSYNLSKSARMLYFSTVHNDGNSTRLYYGCIHVTNATNAMQSNETSPSPFLLGLTILSDSASGSSFFSRFDPFSLYSIFHFRLALPFSLLLKKWISLPADSSAISQQCNSAQLL